MRRFGILMVISLLAWFSANVQATTLEAKEEAWAMALMLLAKGIAVNDAYSHGYLGRGESTVYELYLHADTTYHFIAGGCYDAYDVDIVVGDSNRRILARDTDTDKHAVVQVKPRRSGYYYVAVQMSNSTSDGAHYALLTVED